VFPHCLVYDSRDLLWRGGDRALRCLLTPRGRVIGDGTPILDYRSSDGDALPSPGLNPLEGSTMLSCEKLGLGRCS
jgi:hypothetical protein